MLLRELVHRFDPEFNLSAVPDVEVLGVQEDSRLVRTGDLFIARLGTHADGAQFVSDAHARGAVAVIVSKRIERCSIPQVVISDPSAASILANLYQSKPSTKLKVLGVTGTNGKTTTAYLIRHLLSQAGHKCGMIGTVEIDDGGTPREATMTTPGPVELAAMLATMRDKSCKACAIEVSSHALHQRRAAGVEFAAAGFTNLTGDHLDYHGTMEQYTNAKAILFESLGKNAIAVINADSESSDRMIRNCRAKVIRFAMKRAADYAARDIAVSAQGSKFVFKTPDGEAPISLAMIGRHNIENALCAAAMVSEVFGLSVHQIAAGLKDAKGAPGRLQAVRAGQPFAVLVDYAHTDDALENVLSSLKPLTRGKLRVIFGCGGDRDRTKRPRMARTAHFLADAIYITSDNPRTENPTEIVDEIRSGIPADSSKSVIVEVDRRTAIEQALRDSNPEDVVVIAGKGHENYQIVGATKHHFDDVEEAERILRSMTYSNAR